MKKTVICWPIAALVLGLASAAARLWQLTTGFEGVNPFAIRRSASTVVLALLLIIAAALFLLMALKLPRSPRLAKHPELSNYATGNDIVKVAMVLAAFLSLGGVLFLRDGMLLLRAYQYAKQHSAYLPGGNSGVIHLFTGITSILAFAGLFSTTKALSRGTKAGRLGLMLPALHNCIWLMMNYRSVAPDPERWNYAPLLLAICFGAWFYLEWLGLWLKPAHPRRALWLAATAVVLSFAAMPGCGSYANLALLASQTIAAFAFLLIAPKNMIAPPEHSALADEKLEEDTHE